ncbi:hypothetical protein C8Q76DRAFT_732946 [Earliella scabrosa]|nr:hypothetical protein C8Q76DRAFT_732946 [Earliella scabrosa]
MQLSEKSPLPACQAGIRRSPKPFLVSMTWASTSDGGPRLLLRPGCAHYPALCPHRGSQ